MRLFSVLFDGRMLAALFMGFALTSGLMFAVGLMFSDTISQRQSELARMSEEERLTAELRLADRLVQELLGLQLANSADEAMEARVQALQTIADDREIAPEKAEAASELLVQIEQSQAALREAQQPPPQRSAFLERNAPRPPPGAGLVPPWLAASGCGLTILAFGGIASLLLLRRPEEG